MRETNADFAVAGRKFFAADHKKARPTVVTGRAAID